MPQAVEAYLESNNFEIVDHAKRLILDLYDEDFGKIDPTGKAARIFAAIPAQLNKTHVSLDAFCKKFSSRITNDRYLIYTKDYAHEESVRYIPAYLACFL